MSDLKENGLAISKDSELCLSCGLCCLGIFFSYGILNIDEVQLAEEFGLKYFTIEKGRLAFQLPCSVYKNNKCLIYLNRPSSCKRYRCRLLKRLHAEEINYEESQQIVFRMRNLLKSIDKQTIDLGSCTDFGQRISKFMDLYHKNPIFCDESLVGFFKDMGSFYTLIYRYFA